MSRWVRRLLLLGVAAAGLWVLYRILLERAEDSAGQPPEPPRLNPGRQAPALLPAPQPPGPPISDLAAFRAERAVATSVTDDDDTTTPTGEPEAEPPQDPADDAGPPPAPDAGPESPGRSEPGNLDKVRERLASIHVDRPPSPGAAPNAEVGPAPRFRRSRRAEPWQEPALDGTCAPSHPIKVKVRSGLFHLPGMFAYERTRADRCYRTSADAEADGFERAKR